jgi:hypothetical protein
LLHPQTGCPTHLAFNWWFHPPDNLAPTKDDYRQPYTSDYWPALWAARRPRYLKQQQAAASTPQQQQQQQPVKQKGGKTEQQQQQQPLRGILSPRGGVAKAGAKRLVTGGGRASAAPRRIRWPKSVRDVANRYYRGMTHPNTASGSPKSWPPPRKKGEPPGGRGGGGDDDGDEGSGGGSGSEEEEDEPEDAVAAYFKQNPDAMRALMAQLMAAQGGRRGRGGRGGAAAGRGRGRGRGVASRLAMGRRHHTAVAYRVRRRVPKPQPPM